jgi:hypothetical protein
LIAGKGLHALQAAGKFYEMSSALAGELRGFWEIDLNARSAVPRPISSCSAI